MSDIETMIDKVGSIEKDKQYTVMSISKNDILEHYKGKASLTAVEDIMEEMDDKSMLNLLGIAADGLYDGFFNCVINTVDNELLQ